jgi:hypothetical protein
MAFHERQVPTTLVEQRMQQDGTRLLAAAFLVIAALVPGSSGAAPAGAPFAVRRAAAELDMVVSAGCTQRVFCGVSGPCAWRLVCGPLEPTTASGRILASPVAGPFVPGNCRETYECIAYGPCGLTRRCW